VFLEFFQAFVIEFLFVTVVLGEKLVESSFTLGWKDFRTIPATVLLLAATRSVA